MAHSISQKGIRAWLHVYGGFRCAECHKQRNTLRSLMRHWKRSHEK